MRDTPRSRTLSLGFFGMHEQYEFDTRVYRLRVFAETIAHGAETVPAAIAHAPSDFNKSSLLIAPVR